MATEAGMHSNRFFPLGFSSCLPDAKNDMLMWLMEEAKGQEKDVWALVSRILVVNFAAIHTSSMVRRSISDLGFHSTT